MANRLTSLIAMMILSTIFLVQFHFDLEAFSTTGQTLSKPPGGGDIQGHAKRCKGELTASDKVDCQINKKLAFCHVPTLVDEKGSTAEGAKIELAFQCQGEKYTEFGKELQSFADDVTTHGDSWGRREFGLPSNKVILMLGNSDTQQVAHTLACQQVLGQTSKIKSIQAPLSDKQTAQKITFANNSTLIVITDDKLAKTSPKDIATAIQKETGLPLSQYDGMIWGLLHDCGAVAAKCPNTTESLYTAAVDIFEGPMLFIGMMADNRMEQAYAIRDKIREYKAAGRRNLWFIMGRRYISKLKLEGSVNTDGDADNKPKTGKHGHRCTGALGGHADLLAYDVTEFLYNTLFYT